MKGGHSITNLTFRGAFGMFSTDVYVTCVVCDFQQTYASLAHLKVVKRDHEKHIKAIANGRGMASAP